MFRSPGRSIWIASWTIETLPLNHGIVEDCPYRFGAFGSAGRTHRREEPGHHQTGSANRNATTSSWRCCRKLIAKLSNRCPASASLNELSIAPMILHLLRSVKSASAATVRGGRRKQRRRRDATLPGGYSLQEWRRVRPFHAPTARGRSAIAIDVGPIDEELEGAGPKRAGFGLRQ